MRRVFGRRFVRGRNSAPGRRGASGRRRIHGRPSLPLVCGPRPVYDGGDQVFATPRDADAMNADELVALNEQIAGMARAGLPLDQGLASLAREMSRGRLRRVTEAIAH